MESKRIGGALLTAFSTGAGIMVPYTFKTMSPPIMAVLWASLVFAGIIGLVLALKPEALGTGTNASPVPRATNEPKRPPLIDPDFAEVFGAMMMIPAIMIGFIAVVGVGIALVRVIGWLIGL